jgi:hypothetical protein
VQWVLWFGWFAARSRWWVFSFVNLSGVIKLAALFGWFMGLVATMNYSGVTNRRSFVILFDFLKGCYIPFSFLTIVFYINGIIL